MSVQIDKTNLGYLGEDYQLKLIKEFMEDKDCFKDLVELIDPNVFTGQYLRLYVGTMLEYFKKHNSVPSYSSMSIELRQKCHTQADIEICDGVVDKIRRTSSDGAEQTRELATRFFRQQNFIKCANEMSRLAGNGDLENFERCEKLFRDALEYGTHENYEVSHLYDGFEETMSDEFRTPIPTGMKKIDEVLNGGLGKGELGVIICPTSRGKTSMTTSIAAEASIYRCKDNGNLGYKVIQIVFEDRIKQIQRKHFAKISQVEACDLSKPENVSEVIEVLNNYKDKDLIANNLEIMRFKSGETTIEMIINAIRKRINNGFRPDMIIIDYFECIKLTGPSTMSKWDKESHVMRKIESAANELNIAIWVPVQGNRESIDTDLVTMDKGGGSLGKIQIGHIVLTITRSHDDVKNNRATIHISKNRAGSSGYVFSGVYFNNGTCTISTDSATDYDEVTEFGKNEEAAARDVHQNLQK